MIAEQHRCSESCHHTPVPERSQDEVDIRRRTRRDGFNRVLYILSAAYSLEDHVNGGAKSLHYLVLRHACYSSAFYEVVTRSLLLHQGRHAAFQSPFITFVVSIAH